MKVLPMLPATNLRSFKPFSVCLNVYLPSMSQFLSIFSSIGFFSGCLIWYKTNHKMFDFLSKVWLTLLKRDVIILHLYLNFEFSDLIYMSKSIFGGLHLLYKWPKIAIESVKVNFFQIFKNYKVEHRKGYNFRKKNNFFKFSL